MSQVSQYEQDQGCPDSVDFIVYAEFNCPFSYALNEQLHAMNLSERIDFRNVQRAAAINRGDSELEVLTELCAEVADLRRRSPSVQIAVPLFRPDTAAAAELLNAVANQYPGRASQLRRHIFRALWVYGLDISDARVLENLLHELDIELASPGPAANSDLAIWQSEWNDNGEFQHNLPVVISKQGEKVIGFPLESELNSFLQTGSLISDQALRVVAQDKPLPRILVLDDDVAELRMIIQQMSNAQVEIATDYASLMANALDFGMPDLVLVNTAMIGDVKAADWWRNSSDSNLDTSLPFIFLSDDKSIEAEVAAFEAGAADFFTKPFHPRVLRARLNMHLHARESQRQLNKIARVDGLTSICNRREFDLRLVSEWGRGARSGQSLGLLMIDVDRFKQYNDHYGHLLGDECLIRVAQVLTSCTQRNTDLVARYGGEEFVALLPDSDMEGVLTVAEDFLEAFAEAAIEHAASDVAPYVTVSIGVAVMLPVNDRSSTVLIEQADVALYQAKQNGRNQICRFGQWS